METRRNISLRFWICFLFLFSWKILVVTAQEFEKVCATEVANLDKFVIDYSGNIFVTTTYGDILKIDSLCEELLVFSPTKTGQIKQIDIWSRFKIFAFYEELQEYIVLNRFLTSPVRYSFSQISVGYISNATLNFQQNIWLIDESDFSLKLVDTKQQEVIINQQLNQYLDLSNHEIIKIKESKGKLFVVDKVSGILVFDIFGSFIERIKVENITSINFEREKMIYYTGKDLMEINLNTLEQKIMIFPQGDYNTLRKKNNTFYAISNGELKIYQYLRED